MLTNSTTGWAFQTTGKDNAIVITKMLVNKSSEYPLLDFSTLNGSDSKYTLITINDRVFQHNYSTWPVNANTVLEVVRCPDTLKTIGSYAFYNCSTLTNIVMKGVEKIGHAAFQDTSLKGRLDFTVTGTLGDAGHEFRFKNTDLVHVEMTNVTKVLKNDFYGCAFLTNVVVSPALERVEVGAFCSCKSLVADVSFTNLTFIGRTAYQESLVTNVYLPRLETLEKDAFYKCTNLLSVVIDGPVSVIPQSAFNTCKKVKRIRIPSARNLETSAFHGCEAVTEVYMPQVTNLGNHAIFSWKAMKKFKLPYWTVSIGNVDVFNSWNSIEADGFFLHRATQLNESSYNIVINHAKLKDKIALYGGVWTNEEKTVEWVYDDRDTADYSLSDQVAVVAATNLTGDVVMPKTMVVKDENGADRKLTVGAIEAGAFRGNSELQTFTIPKGVTRIGVEAFAECENLTEIILHGSTPKELIEQLETEYGKTVKITIPTGFRIIVR